MGKFVSKLEGHYEGSWDRDLKHGKGTMKYKNEDKYDGFWEYNKVSDACTILGLVIVCKYCIGGK